MLFTPLAIAGAYLIEPQALHDARGLFSRIFCARQFGERGLKTDFVQRSVSYNLAKGTLRGLHFQNEPYAETKLVRCTSGAIYDVLVDLRPGSPSFQQHYAVELSAINRLSLYIPPGCAHGFLTLSAGAEVYYEITPEFEPEAAAGLRWNDPVLSISWPFPPEMISDKDQNWPLLPSRGF